MLVRGLSKVSIKYESDEHRDATISMDYPLMPRDNLETEPVSREHNDQFHRLSESTSAPSSTNSNADSHTASSSNNLNPRADLEVAAAESRNTSQPVDSQNLFVNRLELAVDATVLLVNTVKVLYAQSQSSSTDTNAGFSLNNRSYSFNFRQARYGHR